jgi:hypothetical protein
MDLVAAAWPRLVELVFSPEVAANAGRNADN